MRLTHCFSCVIVNLDKILHICNITLPDVHYFIREGRKNISTKESEVNMRLKKIFALVLSLCMCLSLVVPVAAENLLSTPISLSGFSYNMDGSRIDTQSNYTLTANIIEGNDSVTLLNLTVSPSINGFNVSQAVVLNEVNENTYLATLQQTGHMIILERLQNEYLIDISDDAMCFSFGGNRIQKMTTLFSDREVVSFSQLPLEYSEVYTTSDVNRSILSSTDNKSILTRSGNGLRLEAIWNPSRDECLSLRFNTTGIRAGEFITRIRINASLPGDYIITSANPSGINILPDFSDYMDYFLDVIENAVETTKRFLIFIPSFDTVTDVSSYTQRSFSFDISPYVNWNDMIYSSSSSSQGMLMHIFLDYVGIDPIPSGTLIVTEHIPTYGTVNVTLSF